MANDKRRVVWVGPSGRADVQGLLESLGEASMQVQSVEDPERLFDVLSAEHPRAILLSPDLEKPADVCLAVRMKTELSLVPVLWVQTELDDLVFAEAFGVGGDDATTLAHPAGIVRRLQALPEVSDDGPVPSRGLALLAEADDDRRVVLARLLRNGGFDVCFAADASELGARLRTDQLTLVVAAHGMPGDDPLEILSQWRDEGGTTPWIVATPPKRLLETSQAARKLDGVWVWDAYAPPENVLYAANEALRGSFAEQRASPRLLYGTAVAFRVGGRDRDDYGFLYNVSGEGLFVRTLAPLSPGDDAWLEFKPPRTDRRVRLEGRVVWRKLFGRVSEATVPPGFGVRITGGSETDTRRYVDGYRALAKELAGIRFSAHPAGTDEG